MEEINNKVLKYKSYLTSHHDGDKVQYAIYYCLLVVNK